MMPLADSPILGSDSDAMPPALCRWRQCATKRETYPYIATAPSSEVGRSLRIMTDSRDSSGVGWHGVLVDDAITFAYENSEARVGIVGR